MEWDDKYLGDFVDDDYDETDDYRDLEKALKEIEEILKKDEYSKEIQKAKEKLEYKTNTTSNGSCKHPKDKVIWNSANGQKFKVCKACKKEVE